MMVRDNHRHPIAFRQPDLFHRGNSVVAGDNGIDPFLSGDLNQVLIDAVSVLHPVRNLKIHVSAAVGNAPV